MGAYDWADVVEYNVDKSAWPEGHWTNEPDLLVWRTEGSPYLRYIKRTPEIGALCGYGWDIDSDAQAWVFGFDCAHYDDLAPGGLPSFWTGTYRGVEYVKRVVERLAAALHEVSK